MQAIDVLVTLFQIGLGAFLLWGAALCMPGAQGVVFPRHAVFERVASLVLLALLYTTLAGLA
jgi:hypothetical protein